MSQCCTSTELSPLTGDGQWTICWGLQAGAVCSWGHAWGLRFTGTGCFGDLECLSTYPQLNTFCFCSVCPQSHSPNKASFLLRLSSPCLPICFSSHYICPFTSVHYHSLQSLRRILKLTSPSCWTLKVLGPLPSHSLWFWKPWIFGMTDLHTRQAMPPLTPDHRRRHHEAWGGGPHAHCPKKWMACVIIYCKTCRHSKWSI